MAFNDRPNVGSQLKAKIETITSSLHLGEGPHWDSEKGLLYFVNLYASEVHSYDPATKEHHFIKIGDQPVTFVIPLLHKEDMFVISLGRDLKFLKWNAKSKEFSLEPYIHVEQRDDSRLNDGKASPSNVLFAGSMANERNGVIPDKQGSLYVIRDQQIKTLLDETGISNGLCWNEAETEMYFNDTLAMKTYKFKYDRHDHTIADRVVLVDYEKQSIGGQPDGLTIDNEGYLWSACIKGSKIIRIDPKTGDVVFSFQMPCTDVTSLAFAGSDLGDLYCTTSTHNVREEDLTPEAGCVLKITGLGVKGSAGKAVKL